MGSSLPRPKGSRVFNSSRKSRVSSERSSRSRSGCFLRYCFWSLRFRLW